MPAVQVRRFYGALSAISGLMSTLASSGKAKEMMLFERQDDGD
jgi:hypothetical protein